MSADGNTPQPTPNQFGLPPPYYVEDSEPRRMPWLFWWILGGIGSILVLGGACYVYLSVVPRQQARQQMRLAEEAMARRDFRDALFQLNKAAESTPNNAKVFYRRAVVLYRLNQDDRAVTDLQKSVSLGQRDRRVYQLMSNAAMRAGQYEVAVQAARELLRTADKGFYQSAAQNQLAYAYALADSHLDEALQLAHEAIKFVEKASGGSRSLSAYLDTRGFVYFRLKKTKEGLRDMDQAILMSRQEISRYDHLRNESKHQHTFKQLRRSLAVNLYHRSLLLDLARRPQAAARDRKEVEELGHMPNEDLN